MIPAAPQSYVATSTIQGKPARTGPNPPVDQLIGKITDGENEMISARSYSPTSLPDLYLADLIT